MSTEEFLLRADQAEDLARDLLEFAGNVRAQFTDPDHAESYRPADLPDLGQTVSNLLSARKHRHRHLAPSLFGEPAWDILLMLFDANLSGHASTVAEVCKAAGPHVATSNRWIAILANYGLVEIVQLGDNDSEALRLTEEGVTQMARTMADIRGALSL
jgi:hypothetical protein